MPKSVHLARSTFYHDRCCFLSPSCWWMNALARAAFLLYLYSASINYDNNVSLVVTAQESTTCGNDLRTIYDQDHYDLWSAFMVDTLEKCRAGISPEMCIQNNSTEFQRMDTITIFEDLRELRTSNEYTGLESACQSEGEQEDGTGSDYIPVEVDMELFIGDTGRLWTIKQLYCFPAACKSVEEYEESFFQRRPDALPFFNGTDNIGHLEFHPQEEPGTSSGACNPSDAAFTNLSKSLKNAYNTYNTRYYEDCTRHANITDRASYCNAVYYSIGEFDGIIVNFHENDSSTQYEAFEDDCYANNGEICTVDVIVTLQRYVGSQVSDLEVDDSDARVDINSYFRGWPQCFPSTCNYTQRVSVAEQTSLDFIFKLATYEEDNEEVAARERRRRTLLRSGGENNGKSTHALAPLASEAMKNTLLSVVENAALVDFMKRSKNTNDAPRLLGEKEDDKSIGEEGEDETEEKDEDDIKDVQQDMSTTRDILLDLVRNIDPSKSPNVTKEYPYEFFDNSNKNKKPQERAFTRSEECPTGIDECFSRLSNVCLRSIGTPIERNDDNENEDENNVDESDEDESEDSLLGDLIPFSP